MRSDEKVLVRSLSSSGLISDKAYTVALPRWFEAVLDTGPYRAAEIDFAHFLRPTLFKYRDPGFMDA
jgi:hypothetical protein